MNEDMDLSPDTLLLHADDDDADTAVVPPIYQTVTFFAENAGQFNEMSSAAMHPRFYTRYGNPTVARTAAVIATLEGAEAALLFPSGMSAISAAVNTILQAGSHVICQEHAYAGAQRLLNDVLGSFGVDLTFVDQRDAGAFERAFRKNTKLVFLETPSHPLMYVTDLKAVATLSRERGAVTIVDNTTATSINQQPLCFGIDLVVHSATKSLGGHSDVQSGAVAGNGDLIRRIWDRNVLLGGTPSPHDAWLLLRGMRTLGLRVERQNANGAHIARVLAAHSAVKNVYYPGLPSHPQHELARKQMRGFSGVIGVELHGGFEGAETFLTHLKRFRRAASIGAIHSLAVHPAAMWRSLLTEEQLRERGLTPGLLRLSLGIDAAADIEKDVLQALDACKSTISK